MNEASHDVWTKQDLIEVARYQKIIIWMVLLSLVASFIPYATIVTGVISLYFCYKLASSLRLPAAWVYVILAFIPVVAFIALLILNGKATQKLRDHGVIVGFMGADMSELNRLM